MRRRAIAGRALVPIILLALIGTPRVSRAQPTGFSLDVGVSHIPWLTESSLVTSLVSQVNVYRASRASLIAALGVNLNLQDQSQPDGTASRRVDIGTARLGLESTIWRGSTASVLASASMAGSWFRYDYGGTALVPGVTTGGGWVSGIYGLRAKFGKTGSPAYTVRYEIRPRYGDLASFNPYLGVGIAF